LAVVGASKRPGSAGRLVLENLLHLGYQGAVYPVHPRHSEVLGFPCYPDLRSLPGPVESVAVLLGADKVLPVLEQAVDVGARAAWVLASGFGEAGEDGRAREADLARFARESGLLVCGPNCIGVANLVDGVATYSVALSPKTHAGGVSSVVQSGAICLGLANAARFGFRYLISSGNEAVLDSADYIGHLADDSLTEVIVAFLEGIRSPEKFVQAAEAAARNGKPILVVKVGRSEIARKTVQAHTGSLAGSDRVVDAAFHRLGVMRLDTLDELMEAAELLVTCPLPAGDGVGLLSLSGGQIGLIADLAQDLGLDFPPFSAGATAALERILPPFSPIANPLDAWGSGDLEATYPACVDVVSQEDDVHLLAVSRDTPVGVAAREVEQSVAVAEAAVRVGRETGKPVLMFSNHCAGLEPRVQEVLEEGGVPYLQGTRETLRAIQALLGYGEFQRRRTEIAETGCPSPASLPRWRQRLQEGALSEVEGRRLLADYGVRGPEERLAVSADAAVEAARTIGFPVVLKILSPDIHHKTEIGGVRVGLGDDQAVRSAFQEVLAAARERHPEADLHGVLIQEMVGDDAVEVIVGLLQEDDFGPVIVFGSGGILVELFKDSSLRLPPLSRRDAREMIQETQAARLLTGFRGRPAADVEALVDALVRVSQLAVDLGDLIAALDINPMMVLPEGEGVRAVDTLVDVVSSGLPCGRP
jgi:acyl-CoA synthetase (NDP forming)